VTKTTGGNTTLYIYSGAGELAAEYSTQAQTPLCNTCFLAVDHLGSTRMVMDESGAVKARHDYFPWGEELLTASRTGALGYQANDGVSQKFTGKERDAETGLDYFGARYFSSAQGRFTSPDEFKGGGLFDPTTGKSAETIGPLPYADITDPQTLNKYAYVRNNPLRYIDPDGHDTWDIVKGAFNAFTSDNQFGVGRSANGNDDFQTGQAIGDALATVTGTAETLFGGGEALVTSPAAATGVGIVVPAAGVAVAAHGAATAAIGSIHLAVKAKDAAGVTAGGQATDKYGNKLGPSGEPQVNKTKSNTREAARNKALNEGSGATEHRTPTEGDPHFHPTDAKGNKKPTSTHHEYPE